VLALFEGRLHAEGPPSQVICAPVLNQLYHIDSSVVSVDGEDIHILIRS
jgi:ABC-type enterochelin transport system ATPase subunit